MESVMISASCLLLGLEVLLLWKYQRDELRNCRDGYLTRLEEVARAAEIIRRTCFTSLDELHKRFETLQTAPSRIASAEVKSDDGVEPADLVGQERSHGAAAGCAGEASIEPAKDLAAPLTTQSEPIQDRQTSAAEEKASSISQSDREPAKPARRLAKKKPARREARKPIMPVVPVNGIGYGASAAKSAMAVKL